MDFRTGLNSQLQRKRIATLRVGAIFIIFPEVVLTETTIQNWLRIVNMATDMVLCRGSLILLTVILSQTKEQKRLKLKHHFYSPNIQSKSIIDSQTRTVKIQPFFRFFLLRYRGPPPENSSSPFRIYMLSFHHYNCMFMVHYLYKLFKWPCEFRTFFIDLGPVVFANYFALYRTIQPITEANSFDFQMIFSFSVALMYTGRSKTKPHSLPGVPFRLKQTLGDVCKYYPVQPLH